MVVVDSKILVGIRKDPRNVLFVVKNKSRQKLNVFVQILCFVQFVLILKENGAKKMILVN